ncbi:hypothetical protein HMN09_00242100 [Mycena chlorophos]|uniref:F-box domain-containing protein n=1 Tax=Mycena chlorophos TaxID=658473 RepID=A0A8H6WNS8_MYCCL|nr:hypothetical protein HMN09_00242100 [Mycena chlorophos]
MPLPTDLLPLILDHLANDRAALYQCLLADGQLHKAAAGLLYAQVLVKPKYGQTNGILDRLESSSLPKYAPYVHTLSIQGLLLPNIVSAVPVLETILTAIRACANLQTLEVVPDIHPDDYFTAILQHALELPSLNTLRVNSSCMSESDCGILLQFTKLRRLELKSPTRAVLNVLPEWLGRLTGLKELHLTSNCGSVTPGVLRSLVPLLQNISAISIGLSYSLTDDDLFDFLGQLGSLQSAHLQHYPQFKPMENTAQMNNLRSLTVLHNLIDDADAMVRFCTWIQHAVAGAPIQRIKLCCDEFEESSFAPRSFDALLRDLAASNGETLRALYLGGWLVSADAVTALFESCVGIEEFSAALDKPGFEEFERRTTMLQHLHTAALRIYAGDVGTSLSDSERIMRQSVALRRLSLDEMRTEGAWVSRDGEVVFVVCELENLAEDAEEPSEDEGDAASDDGSTRLLDSDDDEGEPRSRLPYGIIMGAILEEDENGEYVLNDEGPIIPMEAIEEETEPDESSSLGVQQQIN